MYPLRKNTISLPAVKSLKKSPQDSYNGKGKKTRKNDNKMSLNILDFDAIAVPERYKLKYIYQY